MAARVTCTVINVHLGLLGRPLVPSRGMSFVALDVKKNCLQCYYPGFSSASMLEPLAEKSGSPKAPMQANGVQNSPSANKWIGV